MWDVKIFLWKEWSRSVKWDIESGEGEEGEETTCWLACGGEAATASHQPHNTILIEVHWGPGATRRSASPTATVIWKYGDVRTDREKVSRDTGHTWTRLGPRQLVRGQRQDCPTNSISTWHWQPLERTLYHICYAEAECPSMTFPPLPVGDLHLVVTSHHTLLNTSAGLLPWVTPRSGVDTL